LNCELLIELKILENSNELKNRFFDEMVDSSY